MFHSYIFSGERISLHACSLSNEIERMAISNLELTKRYPKILQIR